jgi:error-prone DNA polymerase
MGLNSIALTDRDGVYGIVQAHVEARLQGIKLIIGSHITVNDGSYILLLVQNRTGYGNLCRLISTGRLRNPKGICSVTWQEVCRYHEGLLLLWTHGLPGVADDSRLMADLQDAFRARMYAVVARHLEPTNPPAERAIRRVAVQYSIPLVAATEVLYHSANRQPLQDVLTCIRHATTLHEAGRRLHPNTEHRLHTPEEFAEIYADAPSLLEQTRKIADRCEFSLDEIEYRYPTERVPEGHSTASWLEHITMQGASARYQGAVPGEVHRQLKRELELIDELEYCGYFLTMWEIVQFCRKKGILCQGRGSAANSAVCYCLGITSVDPVRMELLFERFLSRERAEPPDIDLDIEHDRREEVIQHVYAKYGRAHAAMVANVIRYRSKSAVRDVGKVLGIPATSLDRLAKLLSHHYTDIDKAMSEAGFDPDTSAHKHLFRLAVEIQDFPRHLSIHPGGFLLGTEPITHLVPVENATMEERTVIQWDKYDVETMNLFKVDLLGLGALTHLDYCFDLLRRHVGKDLSMAKVPPGDPLVFRMLQRADTVGVFQVESRAQMAMLPRLKPRNFYDIVIEVSIVRPGPITGGMVHPYLRRRNGEEPVTYPHPDLEPVLKKTLGIPLFQEQVMKLAIIAADYTPGEADQLRRDMAAWRRSGNMDKHGRKIIRRMVAKGIKRQFAEAVFEQIKGFGEYGFPESHAASFALIAYSTAWMKAHYPAVFACGLLNAWPMGFYSPATIVDDAKRHGVTIRPVDVLRSDWRCTIESLPDGVLAVRIGLRYVKGLGEDHWHKILAARRGNPDSLKSFLQRASLDDGALSRLSRSGAFSCFDVDRRSALWDATGSRHGALTSEDLSLSVAEETVAFEELSPFEAIAWDYDTSRHSAQGHPLEPHRAYLRKHNLPDAREVSRAQDGSKIEYAGMVICRQRPGTANGVTFMTLEDETGFVNLVVWKNVFDRFRNTILTNAFLGVFGTLQAKDGTTHLVAESFFKPDLPVNPVKIVSRDFH